MNRWLSLGLVLTLGFLLGTFGFSIWDKTPPIVERVSWSTDVQWIGSQIPNYRFYTRRTFYIADSVQGAWLRLSADNDFILYVNGKSVAQELSVLNNSLGLARQLSDSSQLLNHDIPYLTQSGSEILVASSRDWKLAVYVDLTPYLQPGKNAIALEIQKGEEDPRFALEGAVYTTSEASISLNTGATTWRVSTLSETHQRLNWYDLDFPDQSWSEARLMGAVREATYSRVSPHLFDRSLQGTWIGGTETSDGEVWLRGQWQVPKTHHRSFLRFAGNGEYSLTLNGTLISQDSNVVNQLHLYELTNLLHPGTNTLAVRLARSPAHTQSATEIHPLSFFLDGWVEAASHKITAPIATDAKWISLTQPVSNWSKGVGEGQPATLLGPPDPQEFTRTFEGDAYLLNYPENLLHQILWLFAGMGFALIAAWSLGRFWLECKNGWWDSVGAGTSLLLPGTFFLIGIGLLKHRYAYTERGLLFVQPQIIPLVFLGFVWIVFLSLLGSRMQWHCTDKTGSPLRKLPSLWEWFPFGLIVSVGLGFTKQGTFLFEFPFVLLIFLGFIALGLLTLLWNRTPSYLQKWYAIAPRLWSTWGQWLLLVLIVSIGFGLRTYNLDYADLFADEGVSLDATRGILRTGAPISTSGIWYTRSPAYHYMLALWLQIVGDSVFNARFLAVLWGTATLILVFIFTKEITGKVWIALVVAAFFALDPWTIMFSRAIRFYQVVQFMSLLSFWLLLKGFINQESKTYQYCFYVAMTLTVLNQELTATLLPCFLLGFLFFYRPFNLFTDWSIVLGSAISLVIIAYDMIFFSIKCLTPLVAISTTTDSILKPHLANITFLFNTFVVGFNRSTIIYGCFFLLGFIYYVKRNNSKVVYLFSAVFLNLLILTVLLMQVANRYFYHIYPLFVILAIYSAIDIISNLGRKFEIMLKGRLPLKRIALSFLALLLVSNIEPERIIAGYQDAIFARGTPLFEYIRDRRQPGDVVIANATFPNATQVAVDYFLPGTVAFDTVYWHEGRVVDRWSGGILLSNADQMNSILAKANRVWLYLDDHKAKGLFYANLGEYFTTLGQPVMDSFGTRLRLWQPEDGLLPRVPNEGKDLGSY